MLEKIFRKLVFWVGDVRRLHKFPWITWDVHQHSIDLNEVILKALIKLRPGDIILHRDEGYLSNLFIGGNMVHAGICVENQQVVEAISEGVVKRHAAHILYSDYACILRPKLNIEKEDLATDSACWWANQIIGFDYDYLFEFNGEEERKLVREHGIHAKKMGVRFCCTEIPYFCYHAYLDELHVFRKRNVGCLTKLLYLLGIHPGEEIIDADVYVTGNFEVVWCSRKFTSGWCQKKKMSEEYIKKIQKYWHMIK